MGSYLGEVTKGRNLGDFQSENCSFYNDLTEMRRLGWDKIYSWPSLCRKRSNDKRLQVFNYLKNMKLDMKINSRNCYCKKLF